MNIIGKIFSDKIYMEKFQNELVEARKMLNQRSAIFVKEAEKQGLKALPYLGGFFISVETANQNIFQDLVNEHVFVIPMEGLVRIAVSSLNREEIPRLVSILKKHI
jgi:aspartate/tyrosine/aromatic aminotransferase